MEEEGEEEEKEEEKEEEAARYVISLLSILTVANMLH